MFPVILLYGGYNMEKLIKIGNEEILFRSTGATPIIYRNAFHKDMLIDLQSIQRQISDAPDEDWMGSIDTTILFQMAYAMSGAYQKQIDYYDWLDKFDLFDMVDALFDILSMWTESTVTIDNGMEPKNHEATVNE